jgi:hypothetical protein
VTHVPVWLLLGDLVDVSAGVSLRAALKADTSIVAWGSVSGSYQGNGFVLGTASPTDDPDGDGLTTTEEWAALVQCHNRKCSGEIEEGFDPRPGCFGWLR